MGKNSFNIATWAYIIGWIPISIIVGYISHHLGWDETIHPLTGIFLAALIFLIYAIPVVNYLEKKKK